MIELLERISRPPANALAEWLDNADLERLSIHDFIGTQDRCKGPWRAVVTHSGREHSVAEAVPSVDLRAGGRAGWYPAADELTLAVARKGLPAIEQFAYGRDNMYRHVYLHKTALGFEIRLRGAIDEVLADERHRASLTRMLGDIDAFGYLTDHFFWERFREIAWAHPGSEAAAMLERRKMSFLGELDTDDPEAVERERARLAETLGVPTGEIRARSTVARFARGQDPRRALRVALTDRLTGEQRFESIEDHSDLWTRLPDARRTALFIDPARRAGEERPSRISA